MNLYYSLKAWLTDTLPPWTVEAREAAEEEAAARAEADAEDEAEGQSDSANKQEGEAHSEPASGSGDRSGSESGGSTSSSVRSARALARYKRSVMALGLGGTFFCWAIFAWCGRLRGRALLPVAVLCTPRRTVLRSADRTWTDAPVRAGSSSSTGCCSTNCLAKRGKLPSHARGAFRTASVRRPSGRTS